MNLSTPTNNSLWNLRLFTSHLHSRFQYSNWPRITLKQSGERKRTSIILIQSVIEQISSGYPKENICQRLARVVHSWPPFGSNRWKRNIKVGQMPASNSAGATSSLCMKLESSLKYHYATTIRSPNFNIPWLGIQLHTTTWSWPHSSCCLVTLVVQLLVLTQLPIVSDHRKPVEQSARDHFVKVQHMVSMPSRESYPPPQSVLPQSKLRVPWYLHHNATQLYQTLCTLEINNIVHGTMLLYMTSGCVRTKHHHVVSSVLYGLGP